MPPKDDTTQTALKCRVTKKGDGKIFTGDHTLDGEGKPTFTTYRLNDVIEGLSPAVASALEDKDLVEVLG